MKRYGPVASAFILGALSVAGVLIPLLHRRLTAHALASDFRNFFQYVEYRFDNKRTPIDCWGDSLTEGKGLTPGHDYPHLVSYMFHKNLLNKGVAGETSFEIKTRMLSRNASFVPENAIIWAGRNDDFNNIDQTEKNIDEMIKSLHPRSKFLVIGILNSDTSHERKGGDRYEAIIRLNRDLHDRYGKSFVPIRDILVAQGNKNDPNDDDDIEADVVPSSLRLDALHLNDQGEALVAYAVEAAITANGW